MTNIKVLIDDDILIQLGKQLEAEKLGYQLDCYFSIDEFLAVASKYDEEIPIYLGGEFEEKGQYLDFKNVYSFQELTGIC